MRTVTSGTSLGLKEAKRAASVTRRSSRVANGRKDAASSTENSGLLDSFIAAAQRGQIARSRSLLTSNVVSSSARAVAAWNAHMGAFVTRCCHNAWSTRSIARTRGSNANRNTWNRVWRNGDESTAAVATVRPLLSKDRADVPEGNSR